MNKQLIITTFVIICFVLVYVGFQLVVSGRDNNRPFSSTDSGKDLMSTNDEDLGDSKEAIHPLSIQSLRDSKFAGSEITIEQTLSPGSNYQRYLTSYKSEGLKIFALLTVPNGEPPLGGWPAVIFNHGYIAPAEYRTTERYIAYTDAFSRNGYVLFRTDYRGHGDSEGKAEGGYGSNSYTIDVLNAFASVQKFDKVNSQKIGMWGHSMGGHITLRSMVVNKDIKAGVIWAGVAGSYKDIVLFWRQWRTNPDISEEEAIKAYNNNPPASNQQGGWRRALVETYGLPSDNSEFWNSISSTSYLDDISGPLQLHHGTADSSVPIKFSEKLYQSLKDVNKEVELYSYSGDDHNLTYNFGIAIQRSVDFFDKYLK